MKPTFFTGISLDSPSRNCPTVMEHEFPSQWAPKVLWFRCNVIFFPIQRHAQFLELGQYKVSGQIRNQIFVRSSVSCYT